MRSSAAAHFSPHGGVTGGSGRSALRARRYAASHAQTASFFLVGVRARMSSFSCRGRARSRRSRAAASASIFFPRCSSAVRRRSFSIRRATGSPISFGRCRAIRRGVLPRSKCSSCRSLPSRRALVNSKALQDYAAANLQDEFREVRPLCFLVPRPRRSARQPHHPHHRRSQRLAVACREPPRRRSGASARRAGGQRADPAGSDGDRRTCHRRLPRSVGRGARSCA